MPKKRPRSDVVDRAHDLAAEGKTQAAKSVLRAERNRAAERSGGNLPSFRAAGVISKEHTMEAEEIGDLVRDFVEARRRRRRKKD